MRPGMKGPKLPRLGVPNMPHQSGHTVPRNTLADGGAPAPLPAPPMRPAGSGFTGGFTPPGNEPLNIPKPLMGAGPDMSPGQMAMRRRNGGGR